MIERSNFPPCRNAWCGDCFEESNLDRYPRMQGVEATLALGDDSDDEEGDLMMDDQDLERYRRGRNGDHIMGVPFSCELCHFRNVNLRDPLLDSSKDVYTLTAMRRANIDVCWAREPSTVRANLNRARRDFFETEEHCTIEHQSLPFLPDPDLKDKVGMRHALRVLQASLRSGRYTQNVQFETVRKTEAWIGNMHDAGEGYRGTPVGDGGGLEDKRGSSCETRGRWFRRFMRGVKLRMGQVRYQNEPITSEIILELDAIISAEWRETVDEERKEHLEELMCFILDWICMQPPRGRGSFGFAEGNAEILGRDMGRAGSIHYGGTLRPLQGRDRLQVALPPRQR